MLPAVSIMLALTLLTAAKKKMRALKLLLAVKLSAVKLLLAFKVRYFSYFYFKLHLIWKRCIPRQPKLFYHNFTYVIGQIATSSKIVASSKLAASSKLSAIR